MRPPSRREILHFSAGATIFGLSSSLTALPSVFAATDLNFSPRGFFPFVTPRFVVRDAIMTHGEPLVFNICRKHPFGRSTVDYAITAGTAVEGSDYDGTADALSGTLTFEDREIYKTVSVQTLAHGRLPSNRTITCTLSIPQDSVIDTSSATGTIQRGRVTKYTDATPLSIVRSALNDASPGDAVLLERGGEWTGDGDWYIDGAVGNSTNPIIFGAYGDGDPPNIHRRLFVRGRYKKGTQTQYLRVQDLQLRRIVCFEKARPYGPKELDFIRMRLWGGGVGLQIGSQSNHIRLECSDIRNQTGQGCLGLQPGIEVRFNKFFNNGGKDPVREWQIYVGHENCIVEYNVCDGNNRTQGIKFVAPVNGLCRGNEIKNCHRVGLTTGTSGSLGIAACKGNVFEENIIYNSSACLLIREQHGSGGRAGYFEGLFRNNVFVHGDADKLIIAIACEIGEKKAASSNNQNLEFYNNTIMIGPDISAAYFGDEEVPGTIWRNNLVVGFGGPRTASVMVYGNANIETGITMSNNLYPADGNVVSILGTADYSSLTEYKTDRPDKEANSIENNGFAFEVTTYDLDIDPRSPAVDGGYDTTARVPNDLEGGSRSIPLAIGALNLKRK